METHSPTTPGQAAQDPNESQNLGYETAGDKKIIFVLDLLRSPQLMERLAAIEHDRWAHWQQYMHSRCTVGPDGSLTIPAELVERWSVQMSTPYEELPEEQRESDREQVRRYLPVLEETFSPQER